MSDNQTDWQRWLEFFFHAADFGPAHEDVLFMIYEDFKKETGITLPDLEEAL